jgi:hypothetical protein
MTMPTSTVLPTPWAMIGATRLFERSISVFRRPAHMVVGFGQQPTHQQNAEIAERRLDQERGGHEGPADIRPLGA